MTDYYISVFWSTEDECWVTDIPDLKFCSAHGETPEQALHEALVAKEAWLASRREHGDRIPEPRYHPAIYA